MLITEVPRAEFACTIVVLSGELDATTSPRLDKVLAEALAAGRMRLIIDARALAFCDSSGLRTLLIGLRHAFAAGGWLGLVGVHGVLERIMRITHLYEAFPVHADLAAALEQAARAQARTRT
ncbi:STAS domain-containing protein [Planobispora takensis]|uniref:Anti-sigma factor antagonist n=1 Tax=Planobispora takensis TaxID=1367882 RepID=A0A8J3T798_9ACTN|nr:STAS domain-containing protein [Planobispora takensis]GII05731.1 anti-sigma factor antagonist [Planobispora takensis]